VIGIGVGDWSIKKSRNFAAQLLINTDCEASTK